jgi:hypothetical protein
MSPSAHKTEGVNRTKKSGFTPLFPLGKRKTRKRGMDTSVQGIWTMN